MERDTGKFLELCRVLPWEQTAAQGDLGGYPLHKTSQNIKEPIALSDKINKGTQEH